MFTKEGRLPLLALGCPDNGFDTFELKKSGDNYTMIRSHVTSLDFIPKEGFVKRRSNQVNGDSARDYINHIETLKNPQKAWPKNATDFDKFVRNVSGVTSGDGFWEEQTKLGNVIKISSLSEIQNNHIHGFNIINYLATDSKAHALAQEARTGTGFATLSDRMSNRLTEEGTVQFMTFAEDHKPVFHLYPKVLTSHDGQGYTYNSNSLLLDDAVVKSMAESLKVQSPYFVLVYHDHGDTASMSQEDVGWASSRGVVIATNGKTAYIAIGLSKLKNGESTIQLYEGPIGILNLQ